MAYQYGILLGVTLLGLLVIISISVLNRYEQIHNNYAVHNDHLCNYRQERYASDDPCLLLKILQKDFQLPPFGVNRSLVNPQKTYFSQMGQDGYVDFLLKGKRNGFFVESGGYDGETYSNSLFFERERGWDGLLIEPDPKSFHRLKSKYRSAYIFHNCLSPINESINMMFQITTLWNAISGKFSKPLEDALKFQGRFRNQIELTCYPLESLLLAFNKTHVDYFSLDIEGAELEILRTIPWGKVTINVITVEVKVLKHYRGHRFQTDAEATQVKYQSVKDYVLGTGLYDYVGDLPHKGWNKTSIAPTLPIVQVLDVVFKRKMLI